MAAFELIKPLEKSLKKIASFTDINGQIVLDMANPYNIKSKSKHLTKDDVKFIKTFFKNNGFRLK